MEIVIPVCQGQQTRDSLQLGFMSPPAAAKPRVWWPEWKTPYSVEVTGVLKAGRNSLEINVTNLWTNRMQGDKHLPVDQQFTFATNTIFGISMEPPGIQLIPSGLIGPVSIITTSQ